MISKRGLTAVPDDVQWHCPYCETTEQTLQDIQQHITESTGGEHEGVSGEIPDKEIIATTTDGEEINMHEAMDVIRSQDAPLEGVSKRKQVVYAWLANDREKDADAIAAVTDADRKYAQQILGQIRRGEITQDYWADDLDRQLLRLMEERLEEYDPTDSEIDSMSQQQEQTQAQEQDGEDMDVPEKTIVLNAVDLAGEDLNRKQAWTALSEAGLFSSGYEYFRRTYKGGLDGEHDVEDAVDEQIQSVIEPVLFKAGLLDQDTVESEEDVAESDEETVEKKDSGGEPATADPSASTSTSRPATGGGVSAEDIQSVREKADLLREQAEFEAAGESSSEIRKAEFIAEKTVEWLDELIEQAE